METTDCNNQKEQIHRSYSGFEKILIFVTVIFLSQVIFAFLLFLVMVMYAIVSLAAVFWLSRNAPNFKQFRTIDPKSHNYDRTI